MAGTGKFVQVRAACSPKKNKKPINAYFYELRLRQIRFFPWNKLLIGFRPSNFQKVGKGRRKNRETAGIFRR